MQDLLYLTLILAFFALCVAYVRGLDRIVRAAEDADDVVAPAGVADEGEEVVSA